MKPSKDKTYFIKYAPDHKDSEELAYTGSGIYRGNFLKEENGTVLFFMEELDLKEGFADGGWFSSEDIIGEVIHE
jgi:hypothetical protein